MTCPYCMRAKRLLESLDIPFQEVDLTESDALREELTERYKWRTVPMIMIGDEFIGGYDELAALHADGDLKKKVTV